MISTRKAPTMGTHEGTSGHAVLLGDSGHVHDGAGRCAEAVAAEAGAHDSSVIVGAQDPEHHEVGDDGHKHNLAEHHQQHAAHEVQQIPEAQGHEGEAQIEVQHHGAQLVGQLEAELVEVGLLVHVAEDDGNKHCSHVAGERHADELADPAGEHGSDGHADDDGRHVLDDVKVGEVDLLAGGIDALHVGVAVVVLLGLQVVLHDQASRQRSADQNAGDQAEGSGSGAHADSRAVAHLFKGGAVGARRAVSADHGDGAGQQGVGGLKADNLADCDADHVLKDGDDTGHQPVDHQQHAAPLQQGEAGAETHGGEEGQHEGALEIRVKLEGEAVGHVSDEGDNHEQEAAHHRCGNAVLLKERNLLLDPVSDQKKNGSKRQSKNGVTGNGHDTFGRFKCHYAPSSSSRNGLIYYTTSVLKKRYHTVLHTNQGSVYASIAYN